MLDPFSDYPVLMTGSHNLGVKASQKNDDNLVILEGPEAAPLAVAYAIGIIAKYQTIAGTTTSPSTVQTTKSGTGSRTTTNGNKDICKDRFSPNRTSGWRTTWTPPSHRPQPQPHCQSMVTPSTSNRRIGGPASIRAHAASQRLESWSP